MSIDPSTIIGEILGEPSATLRNPANLLYECPYISDSCTKKGHSFNPYPVCSVWAGKTAPKLICACPVRFFETDFVNDIIRHCWPGTAPTNIKLSYEVKMATFGKVDLVISDVDPTSNKIKQFVSVELQAVDFTGSVELAYSALTNNAVLETRPNFNPNWANVRKRLVSQLIIKGFYHHIWKTRMVAVLQTPLYNRIRQDVPFRQTETIDKESNIIFALYDYKPSDEDGILRLTLDKIVGTSHNDLMMAPLYQDVPDREEFCKKIISQMR